MTNIIISYHYIIFDQYHYIISNIKSSPDPISNIHTFSSAAPPSILVLAASDNVKESIREEVTKKAAVLLDFVQITSPQFGQLVQLILNAKNVDLSDIQNDSLSKILLNKGKILA